MVKRSPAALRSGRTQRKKPGSLHKLQRKHPKTHRKVERFWGPGLHWLQSPEPRLQAAIAPCTNLHENGDIVKTAERNSTGSGYYLRSTASHGRPRRAEDNGHSIRKQDVGCTTPSFLALCAAMKNKAQSGQILHLTRTQSPRITYMETNN